MSSWLPGFGVAEWIKLHLYYLEAAAAVGAGFYLYALFDLAASNPLAWLLRPIRYFGLGLIVGGVAFGYGTFREGKGAADCLAAWQAKNLQAKLAALARDRDGWKMIAEFRASEIALLSTMKDRADDKIAEHARAVAKLSAQARACRRATGDDDRRLCDLVGHRAAGCRSP